MNSLIMTHIRLKRDDSVHLPSHHIVQVRVDVPLLRLPLELGDE